MVKTNSKKEYSGSELKRYIGAIMEEVRDGFKLQKEQSDGINQKLEEINTTLDSHSNQIANLTMDMLEVKSDTKQIKLDIKLNLNNKIDKKHFVDLEGRVRILEKNK